MTAVVFLGPSLALEEARAVLPDALYLPPVAQGDLLDAIEDVHPDVVGIVDGVFFLTPPVWHKEILLALERGIAVYGASSMGALRAAECDAFGMVGIGEVYRRYAAGELTDDDEVALMHGDASSGWRAISEPLVNVRASLEAAVAAGSLSEAAAETAVAAAKSLWFPERTKSAMVGAARDAGLDERETAALADVLDRHYVDVKRADAVALLEAVARAEREPPHVDPLELDRSIVFLAFLERDRRVRRDGVGVRREEIKRHVAVEHPAFGELLDRAADRLLVAELAKLWHVEASDDDVAAEAERLRWRLRLVDDDAFSTWLAANDLDEGEFRALTAREAVARRLRTWVRVREDKRLLVGPVLDELRLRGEYAEWADRAASARKLAETAPAPTPLEPREIVERQIRQTAWRPDPPIEQFVSEAGFADVSDLLDELLLSERARSARRAALDLLAPLADEPA